MPKEGGYQKPENRGRQPSSAWVDDPIQDFRQQFSTIEGRYLIHSSHHKVCVELFQQLVAEIEKATVPEIPENASILGRTNFSYTAKMLDTSDDIVCALLPVLLSAYVYNFRSNRFMNRGITSVTGAFSEQEVETVRKSKIENQLSILATQFVFPKSGTKFPYSSSRLHFRCTGEAAPRPEGRFFEVLNPRQYPSLKFREVLDSVFAIWYHVLCNYAGNATSEIAPQIYKRVDTVLCTKIYLYHTDYPLYKYLNSKGFPTKQKIDDFISYSYASDPPFMPHTLEIIADKETASLN